MKKVFSWSTLFICYLFLFSASFLYYPKWKQGQTEATISWDVSGYYMYLPAFFIYGDAKEMKFRDSIISKYQPSPDFQQAYLHESGNYVFKYSCGQALQFLPFFLIAHVSAKKLGYDADGFSRPYQFMISLGSLIVAFIGLFFLKKILLKYFSDAISALTIFLIVFGTNYLEQASIGGAMPHNNLFTIYSILIFCTISFYKTPTFFKAAVIGFLVGLATLTRPTEIISFLIPVLWGIKMPLKESIKHRILFFKNNAIKVFLAAFVFFLVGSLQLIYWKYATGEWIVYSYQDQGFSWLRPHIIDGFFSYKAGWLIYTPMMIFSLAGFIPLYLKRNELFWVICSFILVFIYLAFAWDIWWYGGSLGQRTMVQTYPLLAFPLAAFIAQVNKKSLIRYSFYIIAALFIYYNIWLTHQAHKGGLFMPEQMTKAYFWKILGTYEHKETNLKLLDTNEEFNGIRKNVKLIYENNFENDTTNSKCEIPPVEGKRSLCLNEEIQWSPIYSVSVNQDSVNWARVSATFRCVDKEWNFWVMTQMIVRFYDDEEVIKENMIRVNRLLDQGETKNIFIDCKTPKKAFNRISVFFWNAEGKKPIAIDNLKIEVFNEK